MRFRNHDVFEARRVAGRSETHSRFAGLNPYFPKVVALESYYRSTSSALAVVQDMFESPRHEHLRDRQDRIRRERRRDFRTISDTTLPLHDGKVAELGGHDCLTDWYKVSSAASHLLLYYLVGFPQKWRISRYVDWGTGPAAKAMPATGDNA